MTSPCNKPHADLVKRRPYFRNNQTNDDRLRAISKRPFINLSQMSPEAHQALMMTQADAKENVSEGHRLKSDGRSKRFDAGSVSRERVLLKPVADNDSRYHWSGDSNATCDLARRCPRNRKMTSSSLGTPSRTMTSRSRSSLSVTERNYSVSDKTEAGYIPRNSNQTCSHENQRHKDAGNIRYATASQQVPSMIGKATLEINNNNIDQSPDSGQCRDCESGGRVESFVLALDQALKDRCINRLIGDITNTAELSQPGKVRALDGGRLTNAQEVVVNVCYEDDDKELVFHDDAEENVKTAKVMTQIRIDLWLKYNTGFPPDDVIDDVVTTKSDDQSQTTEAAASGGPKTAPTETAHRRLSSNKNVPSSKNTSTKKWPPTTKKDFNNNKTMPKTTTNNFSSSRKNTSSRIESTVSQGRDRWRTDNGLSRPQVTK